MPAPEASCITLPSFFTSKRTTSPFLTTISEGEKRNAHTGKHEPKAPRINYAKVEEAPFGKAADPRKAKTVVVHMRLLIGIPAV
jgi:hypothetical protein